MATTTDDVVVRLTAEIGGLQKGMAKGAQAVEGIEKRMAASARRMGAALAAIGAGAAVSSYVRLADGWRGVRNQLLVAGVSVDQLEGKLNDLFGIAQKHGTEIGSLSILYGRLAQSSKELGATESEMLKFVDGVATALRVQGGDASAASGALLQLSQAMGSATVRAEEFNSINEGARPILMAVANGMDEAGGSVSKLRALVLEGKVSSQEFFQSFLKGSASIQEMAGRTEGTVGQSMTRLQNSFMRFVGQVDAGSSSSRQLAGVLESLAKKLSDPALADGAIAALKGLAFVALGIAETLKEIGYQFDRIGKFAPPGVGRLKEIVERHRAAQQQLLDTGNENERKSNRSKRRGGYISPEAFAAMAGGGGSSGGGDAGKDAERAARRYQDVLADLKFEIEQLARAEEEAAFQQDLRNALTAAGVKLGSDEGQAIAAQITKIRELTAAKAEQAAAAEVDAANAKRNLDELHERMREEAAQWEDLGHQAQEGLADALVDIASGARDAGEAMGEFVEQIGKAIAKMLLLKAIEAGVDAVFGTVGGRAAGGLVNAGNPYVVGESGPELFVPKMSGSIVPRGGIGGGTQINYAPTIHAQNGVTRSEMQAALAQDKAAFSRMVPNIVKEQNARGRLRLA